MSTVSREMDQTRLWLDANSEVETRDCKSREGFGGVGVVITAQINVANRRSHRTVNADRDGAEIKLE